MPRRLPALSAPRKNPTAPDVLTLSLQPMTPIRIICKLKLEFFANSHCVGTPTAATIDETPYTATSTFGAVKVSNSNTYQIGNSSGWIITSSGANTVSVDWLSTLNIPDGNGIYCLRLTANDGVEDQTKPATTTLIVDNVAPTAPGALTLNNRGGNYLQLNFGAQTQESNFQKYRIFYKQGTLVTEADNRINRCQSRLH